MAIKCSLSCAWPSEQLELNLSDCLMDMSLVDFSKCSVVLENGSYEIFFSSDEHLRANIKSIAVCVNGEIVGEIHLNGEADFVEGYTEYKDNIPAKMPFLLHYDLVIVSFILSFVDGSSKEYFSDFLLCVSKSEEDAANIQKMLDDLISFDDSQSGEWIFSDAEKDKGGSLYRGKWNKRSYKSLSSYIQLLEQVISCYKSNYPYFRTHGKHTIKRSKILVTHDKVKTVSRSSFNWIIQNTDQLSVIPYAGGIEYQGKNYLPYHIRTDTSKKSWNVYENRVVTGFLYTVLLSAKQICTEFDKDVLDEERIISQIQGSLPEGYRAPIITVKSLQTSFCKKLLVKLRSSIDLLQSIYKQYMTLFDISISLLTSFPRKTSTFCEIKPYAQVFEIIVHWFRYGEYSLEKERLILQVKTLDKLFEYYCLLRILKLLADNGYQKVDVDKFHYKAEDIDRLRYKVGNGCYHNEKDVANTYILSNNEVTATLYYQPVISAVGFENNITLFRTTKPPDEPNSHYYTPDFVLKFSSSEHNEEYVIFDAKFTSRKNIREYRLPEVIQKYSCELCAAADNPAPKMVWILQGRVNSHEAAIEPYHNSPLAIKYRLKYRPVTSYGIVSINTAAVEVGQQLWDEIKNNVSLI